MAGVHQIPRADRALTDGAGIEALLVGQNQVLQLIAGAAPLGEALDALMLRMQALAPGLLGSVLLLDAEGLHLRHGSAPSLPVEYTRALDGVAIGEGVGSCGTAAFRRSPVIVEDIASDPLWAGYRDLALSHGLRACWSVPILDVGDRVLGTFAMYYPQPARPTAHHRWVIDIVTQTAAIAINRHAAEATLRRNIGVLENTLEYMDQGISIFDKDLRLAAANRRFGELLGFPPSLCQPGVAAEQMLRFNAERGDYGPGDVDSLVLQRLELVRRCEAHHFERQRPDGSTLEIRGTPIPGGGFVTIYTDITQRANTERELQRFRAALNLSSDGVYLVDPGSLTVIDCNDGACRALGYSREEMIGSNAGRIFADRTAAQVRAEYARLVSGDTSGSNFEARHQRKDGSSFPVEVNRRVDSTGSSSILVAVARDITERKRVESRLALRARQQEGIARLSQLALGKSECDALFDAAVTMLRDTGADAAALFCLGADGGLTTLSSSGASAVTGAAGATAADSPWRAIAAASDITCADRSQLQALAAGGPAAGWVAAMGSGLLCALLGEDAAPRLLAVFSLRDDAFGDEDRRFVEAVSAVLSTAMQRRAAEQRLAYLAQFDSLTGLPNRSLLRDRLEQAVAQARRKDRHVGVLFIDLDRFKLVNDTFGHHVGDLLINRVAERVAACIRAGDTVGRLSGDEFAVVLADLAQPDDAAPVAAKILQSLTAPFDLEGNETFVTASLGIAVFPHDGEAADALLKDADAAMYRAKETGRDRYCFYTSDLNQRSLDRLQLANDLRHAIERREFCVYYQPKIDLQSGALAGLEALIRWQHPLRGMVMPMDFIPALEESGLIVAVGQWVIDEACAQQRRWIDAGLSALPIAVNLSARQFRSPDLVRSIERRIAAAQIEPGLIELEITESCLMDDPKQAVCALQSLNAAGLKISVDDFGTGYSSLAYLTRLPLTAVKIDRSFVRDLHAGGSAAAIVRAIIDMAHALRFAVIAEGIETAEQADFLRSHGCEQGQGYLFSRPLPASQIGRLLSRRPLLAVA